MSKPKNKDDFRKEIAEEFLHILESDSLAWHKNWKSVGPNAPQNAITKRAYTGINAFYLSLISMLRGYTDPRWVTMYQIMDRDSKYHPKEKWHLQAGSKAVYVEYWFPFNYKEKKSYTWDAYSKAIDSGASRADFTLLAKYTPVFHASMVDGIPPYEYKEEREINVDDLVTTLSNNMGVEIINDGGNRSYYSVVEDRIHLPMPAAFFSDYDYNSVALHELAHSTGHPSRCNRDLMNHFGSESYAYEELVAEMSSCFMGVNLDIETNFNYFDNHKAYVQAWSKEIKSKPEFLVRAIKDATKATNYMELEAGLISREEYEKRDGSSFIFKEKTKDLDLER